MNLIIDIGNTATKLAVFQLDKIESVQTIATKEMVFEVEKLLKKFSEIKQGLLSTVKTMGNLEVEMLQKMLPIKILEASFKMPFKNCYDTPLTLGVDRLALMAAAVKQHPNSHVLVIDAGSCITYDFIDANGHHAGGAISPGRAMRYSALHIFTENLPLLEPTAVLPAIGTSTSSSISLGVEVGIISEIHAHIEAFTQKFGDFTIILTGGDANFLIKNIKYTIFADAELILIGLQNLLMFNTFHEK